MTNVRIVVGVEGEYEGVFVDSEIVLKVLRRGIDDAEIEKTEEDFEQILDDEYRD